MSQTAAGAWSFAGQKRVAAGPRPAAAALAFGTIVLVGASDGGYYRETWRWATLALVAVAAIRLLVRREVGFGALEWPALGALGALAAWMLASAWWGVAGVEATRETERCALYVAALGALLLVTRTGSGSALLTGTLGGIVALAAYALGERVVAPLPLDPYQGALLTGPVGYANALGILAAIGVLLALGLLWEERERARRALLVAAAGICASVLALTSSRGACLALFVGAIVLLGFRLRVRLRALVTGLAALGIALVLVGAQTSLGDRPAYWRVAVDDAAEHPLLGTGAGTFDDYWLLHRPIPAYVRDAHSLYLETAAELGAVGLVLLLCTLVAPLLAVRNATNRGFAATALAGYVTFLVHAGLDWDWEMPVTTIAGLACGVALLADARRPRDVVQPTSEVTP